jgi:hypothetical protein
MKKNILVIAVLLLSISSNGQVAKDFQTPCATSSQNAAGSAIISYTIGEMVLVENYKKVGLFVTSGILQPSVPDNTQSGQIFFQGEVVVFPNPTPNILSIQYSLLQKGKMSAQVFDASGKRLITDEFVVNSFNVKRYDLARYANGMYVLILRFEGEDGITIKKGHYKILKQ